MDRVVILDGYTDEPAGLGVPPYLDVYPRYVAGAAWSVDKSIDVRYFTIDQVRGDWAGFVKIANETRVLIVIAGIVTPGKYLGGEPIRLEEIERIANMITKPIKILGGPVARFGYGSAGSAIAIPRSRFQRYYDLVVTGDADLVVYELLRNSYQSSKVSPALTHVDYGLINKFAVLGARVVTQHPNYGKNLIIELETYKSCPRYITGGCSFCATVRYGPVKYREAEAIVEEVEALYSLGLGTSGLVGRPTSTLTWPMTRVSWNSQGLIQRLLRSYSLVLGTWRPNWRPCTSTMLIQALFIIGLRRVLKLRRY